MKDEVVIALVFLGVIANSLLPVFFPGQNLVFLLSGVATLAFLTQVRSIRDKPTRAFLLVIAGIFSFWLTGASLVQSDISVDSLPLFVFALSTAQTVLVSYILSSSEGVIFGATGFALVISGFNFGRDPGVFAMPIDHLMLIAVLTSVSQAIWAWLVGNSEGLRETFLSIGKASLVASALNFVSFYIQYGSFSDGSRITWFYFLSHAVVVGIMVLLHEFVTSTYNIRREVTEAGVKYRAKLSVEEAISEDELTSDPFADLISEMEEYQKSPPKNKLAATQTLARFKNELRVLSSRYDTPSKRAAEKLLGKIGG